MLAMPIVHTIKILRNEKSFSINKIANTLNIAWTTAKKYADEEQVPQEKQKVRTGMMYDEGWGEIVSDWLWEDEKLKKKQRRNNKNIFEALQTKGFEGSYRTVCLFIQEWRESKQETEDNEEETEAPIDQNMTRLSHPPGEAQLDFGHMEAVRNGELVDIHTLILSLPFSNGFTAIPLPGENTECLLHGLQEIFKQLDCVPRSIRIDNMRPAVAKARSNGSETVFTDEFLKFANFYGFTPIACNPRSGNEKGNVENKVGYVRYNFMTPAPVIEDLEHLSRILARKSEEDRERLHYRKGTQIKELLDEEKKHCLGLPETTYPVFREEEAKANKYGEITLDKEKVYVPRGANFAKLHVVKYWDSFKVVSPFGEILLEDHRPYMGKTRKIPWKEILTSLIRKPRAVDNSRHMEYLPQTVREYLSIPDFSLRKERLRWVVGLLGDHSMQEIGDRFYELEPACSDDTSSHPYEVDWSKYDSLQSTGKEVGA